jgi:hypothetical protein
MFVAIDPCYAVHVHCFVFTAVVHHFLFDCMEPLFCFIPLILIATGPVATKAVLNYNILSVGKPG